MAAFRSIPERASWWQHISRWYPHTLPRWLFPMHSNHCFSTSQPLRSLPRQKKLLRFSSTYKNLTWIKRIDDFIERCRIAGGQSWSRMVQWRMSTLSQHTSTHSSILNPLVATVTPSYYTSAELRHFVTSNFAALLPFGVSNPGRAYILQQSRDEEWVSNTLWYAAPNLSGAHCDSSTFPLPEKSPHVRPGLSRFTLSMGCGAAMQMRLHIHGVVYISFTKTQVVIEWQDFVEHIAKVI